MSATYRSKYEALVGALHEEDKRMLACRIARWALTEFEVEDPRLWEAVDVAERYAHGNATQEELRAARVAADWAARLDTEDASRFAAWAAVWSAENTAEAAVGAADWAVDAAAESAVRSAWDAARDAQEAAAAAARDTRATAYKMFFEWALELMIGEKVAA